VQQKEVEKEKEGGGEEGGLQQVVMVTAAAFSVMTFSGTDGQKDQEGEEEECSVYLNVIESDDVDSLAGPPLVCGHCYYAFCLHFWVERCRSKCIEATCPYCRSPLPDGECLRWSFCCLKSMFIIFDLLDYVVK